MENLIKKLNNLREKVVEVKKTLDIERKKSQARELEFLMSKSDFWDNQEEAVKISQDLDFLKMEINRFEDVENEIREAEELAALSGEYDDNSAYDDISKKVDFLEKKFKRIEFFLLFSEETDPNNAIISIHSGSGGVDAQDWSEMLERMYMRFAEKKGFKIEILNRVTANEAGIKNSTIKIYGPYAYGHLKSENGVHRLVRISPFDAEGMRHTSFSGVEVIPEIKDNDDIEIEDKDLRIDFFKSSGPGGQSVNTTDSAVRVVYKPLDISASCQSERSQHQNKERAMEILRSKIYQINKEKKESSVREIKGDAGQGSWGKQIRSYIFHPYQMVKDHRTGFSTNDISNVMDGDLDNFIEDFLNFKLKSRERKKD
jgi:peptide chain release factor 2